MADTKEQLSGNQNPLETSTGPDKSSATPTPESPADGKPNRRPILIGVAVVALIFAIYYGINFYKYSQIHVSTDDAYVTGDLINVSPQISGNLQTLLVKDGDYVTKGQLIATIDPSGPEAALKQAEANYQAAQSQVPVAQKNLEFQKLSSNASIKKAQAALDSQRSKTNGAQQQVSLTQGTVSNQVTQAQASVTAANAQWDQAKAQVKSAEASKTNLVQAVQTARDALSNYQEQVVTAQHAQQAAIANAHAAAATAEKAAKDAARFQTLYSEDAVSAQQNDQAQATAQSTQAQSQAAQSTAQQATSQVESARRAAAQARSQVEQAKAMVTQVDAQIAAAQKSADAAQQQVKVAEAGLGVAQANLTQVGVQQANLSSNSAQVGEAEADVDTAQSSQAEIAARDEQVKTALAQAAQAKAALTNAQINLGYTKIYAPADGEVVRKDSNVGATLSPGSTIVTLTKGHSLWISANFKETQLADVRVGQPAEVEVDALPGLTFKGKVRDITEATGAATALLPPDNATGNFTKVVQRVPVLIDLVPAGPNDSKKFATQAQINQLRQGMSVTATINTAHKNKVASNDENSQPATDNVTDTSQSETSQATPGNPQDTGQPAAPPPATLPGQPSPVAPPSPNKLNAAPAPFVNPVPMTPPSGSPSGGN